MTAVMEDEVLAEQGEEASLVAGCRTLLRAVTKVRGISMTRHVNLDRVHTLSGIADKI